MKRKGIIKSFFAIAIAILAFTGCKEKEIDTTSIDLYASTIDPTAKLQIIRGFGGATVYANGGIPSLADMNTLFGTGDDQLGMSILRIRVAPDTDPNWRAVELTNAQRAKANGAIIIASPWSPPTRMKSNESLIGGSLKVDSSANYANYLNNFAKYMADNGAPLYAISIQNEPDIKVTYESCDWTSEEMKNFLKNYGQLITNTQVIAPESFNFNQTYTDVILNDAGAAANVDIIGGHIYGAGLAAYANATNKGKELWMTEHLDTTTTFTAVLNTAKEIHDCLTKANHSAYIHWFLKRFYGLITEKSAITKRGLIMAQFGKFIRPGYYRATVEGVLRSNIFISAYTGEKLVIVALNIGPSEITQKFIVRNSTKSTAVPYTTSESKNLEAGSTINIIDNNFTYKLPSRSVTTFVIE